MTFRIAYEFRSGERRIHVHSAKMSVTRRPNRRVVYFPTAGEGVVLEGRNIIQIIRMCVVCKKLHDWDTTNRRCPFDLTEPLRRVTQPRRWVSE